MFRSFLVLDDGFSKDPSVCKQHRPRKTYILHEGAGLDVRCVSYRDLYESSIFFFWGRGGMFWFTYLY